MKVLLHSCYAPCSAAILEWMQANGYEPTIFYYNPNIYPMEEYLHRKGEITAYAAGLGIPVVDEDSLDKIPTGMTSEVSSPDGGPFSTAGIWQRRHDQWLEGAIPMSSEPERGSRCLYCFKFRLLHAAEYASRNGFTLLTTTLMSSRWKDIRQIMEAGEWAASQFPEVTFWDKNWRKGGLYERRNLLARQFYNQQYCGCEFSVRNSADTEKES